MTINWTWTLNSQNYPVTRSTYNRSANVSQFHSTMSCFRDTRLQDCRKSEIHRMTPNWSWKLNSQRYYVYIKYLPPVPNFGPLHSTIRPNFSSVLLYDLPFSRYKIAENEKFRKCTESPQTHLEILTVKGTSYTPSNYPRGPNLGFAQRPVWDTNLSKIGKIGNAPNDLKCHWTLKTQKYLAYTKYLVPRPKFWSVSIYWQPFFRYRVVKNRKNRKYTEWLHTDSEHLTVKIKNYLLSPEAQIVASRFSYIAHFI